MVVLTCNPGTVRLRQEHLQLGLYHEILSQKGKKIHSFNSFWGCFLKYMLIEKIQIMKIMKVAKILTRKSQLTFPVYTFPPCILGFKTDFVCSVCVLEPSLLSGLLQTFAFWRLLTVLVFSNQLTASYRGVFSVSHLLQMNVIRLSPAAFFVALPSCFGKVCF